MNKLVIVTVLVIVMGSCAPSSGVGQDLYSSASSNQMTANAAQLLAQYQRDALTATAQAPITNVTVTAAALIVQNTQAAATSQSGIITQTAAFVQTQSMWTPTPNFESTATMAALNAQQTQIVNQTIRDQLVLQRQQNNNAFIATMGQMAPLLAIVLVVGGILLAYTISSRKMKYQPVPVDERGNVLPILDIVDGTVTDTDRNPNYRGLLTDNSLAGLMYEVLRRKLQLPNPNQMPAITAIRQDATTQRDQLMDLASRGLSGNQNQAPQKKLAAQEMTRLLTGPTLESRFRMVGDPSQLDVIDGEVIQVLDTEWKEGKK